MQTPRRSVLTGQPLPADTSEQPSETPARRPPSQRGPLVLLLLAVLVLLSTFILLAVWRAQPGALPFVPRTATNIPVVSPTPDANAAETPLPAVTPTIAPIPNPGGRIVTQELQSIEMMAGGYGWGLGRRSLWRTIDGGQTWFDVTPPLPTTGPSAAARIDQAFFLTRLHAWFLLPGAVYATIDGGLTWNAAQAPFETANLYFIDTQSGWAWADSGDGPALYHSTDGGQRWEMMAVEGLDLRAGDLTSGSQLSFSDERRGWLTLSGQSAAIYASTDGGQRWEAHALPLPPDLDWAFGSPLAAPQFFDDNFGPGLLPARAVERRTRREVQLFFSSNDGGRSWQAGQPVAASVSHSLPNANSLYVVDSRGVLQRSLDAGRSWQAGGSFRDRFGSGIQLIPQGIDFVSDTRGWAWQVQDGRFILFETVDGGDSWHRLDYTSQASMEDALVASLPTLLRAPTGSEDASALISAACRWQTVDFIQPLLPLNETGMYEGWHLYLNPAQRFTLKLPPTWSLAEIAYACPGQPNDVHRLVIRSAAGQNRAQLTIAFRRPSQAVPLRDPLAELPAGLIEQGAVDFFWRQVPRAVLPAQNDPSAAPLAVYYNAGQEMQFGSQYIFTAVVESDQPGGADTGLDPETLAQAEQILASLEPLRADASVLSTMDVRTTFFDSPDGDWEVQVMLAQPLDSGQQGYKYQAVWVSRPGSSQRWTALERWVSLTTLTSPGGFVWSQDGRWLYLYNTGSTAICPLFEHHNDLRRLDLTSGQVEELNLYPQSSLASLDISPAGDRVAYLPPDYLTNPRIILRSLLDGTQQEIAFNDPLIDHWGAGSIKWSPDGSRLVFAIAGPYCAETEENRIVVLVDPTAGQTRALTARDRWLTINKWLPDGRLRLADRVNNLFTLDLDSGQLTSVPPDPPDRLAEAESYLRGYFMMLHNTWFDPGTYTWAADHYGGSYDELLALNPDLNPRDGAGLFQRACEQNGYYCLRMRRVTDRELIPQDGDNLLFRFTIELLNADGSLFTLRGQSAFEYTVSLRPDGIYRIMNLPPR